MSGVVSSAKKRGRFSRPRCSKLDTNYTALRLWVVTVGKDAVNSQHDHLAVMVATTGRRGAGEDDRIGFGHVGVAVCVADADEILPRALRHHDVVDLLGEA